MHIYIYVCIYIYILLQLLILYIYIYFYNSWFYIYIYTDQIICLAYESAITTRSFRIALQVSRLKSPSNSWFDPQFLAFDCLCSGVRTSVKSLQSGIQIIVCLFCGCPLQMIPRCPPLLSLSLFLEGFLPTESYLANFLCLVPSNIPMRPAKIIEER